MKKFLVSTADVYGYDQNDNELFRGVSMLDTSIEIGRASCRERV